MKSKTKSIITLIIAVLLSASIGFAFGYSVMKNASKKDVVVPTDTVVSSATESKASTEQVSSGTVSATGSQAVVSNSATEYQEWSGSATYTGGDKVLFQGKIYKAKWWSQNEIPGKADVWEDTMETPEKVQAVSSNSESNTTIVPTKKPVGFKVVGYYPAWKPDETSKIRYDKLTNIIYSFAIPTAEGGLRPLENPETAKKIIADAHSANVQVTVAIGGWSYNEIPLESTFVEATKTEQKRKSFADAIIKLCDDYGFDGIDMDWEHPRIDGGTAKQYEALMLDLADRLHKKGKILTSAVLSGVTADGNVYYDAAAQTDKVLSAVDWINVMIYDGGEGERHSSYDFAVNCVTYWRVNRKLSADKVVLGVPFYARPSWASYDDILKSNSKASEVDHINYNGMDVWYNGPATITKKTEYAKQNAGGIMIWEITQDTSDKSKSLISAIK